jgi:hypothetical protein
MSNSWKAKGSDADSHDFSARSNDAANLHFKHARATNGQINIDP